MAIFSVLNHGLQFIKVLKNKLLCLHKTTYQESRDLFYVGIKKKEQIGFALEFWAAKKEILYTNKLAE